MESSISEQCMVCGEMTDHCPPSPFLPYSGWRCQECCNAHRIPYDDLCGILGRSVQNFENFKEGRENWIKWFTTGMRGDDCNQSEIYKKAEMYFDKYAKATMIFFNKTEEDVFHDAVNLRDSWNVFGG